MRRSLLLGTLPFLGLSGFMAWKTHAVARELVDPPFYRAQPLVRVEATYAELAKGGEGDPGGSWSSEEVAGLQLWTLRRAKASKGIVLLLHGFGDDRWGTSPALKWFPDLDAAIFTYRRRDEAMRAGASVPPVTFGARESEEAVAMVHRLEARGWPRKRILLMGRSLGASVGLLALGKLEAEGRGPLAGLVWEGAPLSSTDFAERLVRGPKDRTWHLLAPPLGYAGAQLAGRWGGYDPRDTDVRIQLNGRMLQTPALAFLATQDRLAPYPGQLDIASHFRVLDKVEVATWHLHCSELLGPRYSESIRTFTRRNIPE